MRDAHATRRREPFFALNVLGLFGLFRNKAKDVAPPPPQVEVAPPTPVQLPPPATGGPRDPGLHGSVRFKGLHEDVNPSTSVRPGEMTCQSCDRHFRFFMNANGSKTTANCPGCGRQYRV